MTSSASAIGTTRRRVSNTVRNTPRAIYLAEMRTGSVIHEQAVSLCRKKSVPRSYDAQRLLPSGHPPGPCAAFPATISLIYLPRIRHQCRLPDTLHRRTTVSALPLDLPQCTSTLRPVAPFQRAVYLYRPYSPPLPCSAYPAVPNTPPLAAGRFSP